MTLLIDTGIVPAQHRVEFWAKSSCDVYHPLQIRSRASERFSARMWGDWLPTVGVFRVAAAANTMSRTQRDILAGDPECLHVSILLRGLLKGAQNERETVLRPGDITTYDTSHPAVFAAPEPFDLLVLKLPRASLGKHADTIARLCAITIRGDTGLPRLAARFFCGAAAGLADGSIARHDADVAEHMVDLVRRLYVDLGTSRHGSRPKSKAELLVRAQSYIECRLGDPGLNPEQVARACFISTRYLHRVFESEGTSVCEWIRRARLERCRRDLGNPALAEQPISSISTRWGLPSAPHFSRLFRAAYGCSPRDFRRAVSAGRPADTDRRALARARASAPAQYADAWTEAGWDPAATL